MLNCIFSRWQPGIGDPNWQGWATVLVYLLTGGLAMVMARCAASGRGERSFWQIITLLMIALAVNKQLDLQTAVTAAGRCLAVAKGWYGQRQSLHLGFLIGVAVSGLIFLASLAAMLQGRWARNALPAMGLVVVCIFVLERAVGFHHANRLLGLPAMGLQANTMLEWAGPALISLGAARLLRLSPR